jgi:hypothetical protein
MMWLKISTVDWLLLQAAISNAGLVALALVFIAGATMPMPLLPTTRFVVCITLAFITGFTGVAGFLAAMPNGIIRHTTELLDSGQDPDRIAMWVLIFGWPAAIATWVFVVFSFNLLLRRGWKDAQKEEKL